MQYTVYIYGVEATNYFLTGRTCKTHGIIGDLPAWGVRTDGSLLDYVGYVYCCSTTEENER